MAEAMVAYYSANPNISSITNEDFKHGLKNDFLLDYMVYPQNRSKITHGFCWYNTSTSLFKFKKMWYVFDYISFDGAEARQHPREVLESPPKCLACSRAWTLPSVYTGPGGELRQETPGPSEALVFCAAPLLRVQGHVVLPMHSQPSPHCLSIVS